MGVDTFDTLLYLRLFLPFLYFISFFSLFGFFCLLCPERKRFVILSCFSMSAEYQNQFLCQLINGFYFPMFKYFFFLVLVFFLFFFSSFGGSLLIFVFEAIQNDKLIFRCFC